MKAALSKAAIIRRLKKATEAEDYFPGVLGNPVTFAARWGLPKERRDQGTPSDNSKVILSSSLTRRKRLMSDDCSVNFPESVSR